MDNSINRVSFGLLLFVVCSSLFIYNLNVLSISKNTVKINDRSYWISSHHKELKLLLVISGFGALFFSSFISPRSIVFLLHLCFLSVLYVVPLKVKGKVFSLRKFPLIKIFILTYVWVAVTVLLPCIEASITLNIKVILLVMERFLFIFALALLFDIRDFELDKKAELITIPGIVGMKYAIGIPKLIVVAFVLVSFLFEEFNYVTISRILLAACTMLFIGKIKKEQKDDLFYMFGIDGLMILQFVILIFLWAFFNSGI